MSKLSPIAPAFADTFCGCEPAGRVTVTQSHCCHAPLSGVQREAHFCPECREPCRPAEVCVVCALPLERFDFGGD